MSIFFCQGDLVYAMTALNETGHLQQQVPCFLSQANTRPLSFEKQQWEHLSSLNLSEQLHSKTAYNAAESSSLS